MIDFNHSVAETLLQLLFSIYRKKGASPEWLRRWEGIFIKQDSQITMAELAKIGEHCSVESCRQLDFLPLQCDGCGCFFCLKHHSKVSHDCSKSLLVSSSGQYPRCPAYNCNLPGCHKKELVPVLCEHCHLNFCLSHRHQQDHICSQIKKELVPTATAPQHVSKILGQKKYFKTARSREMAAKVALMKLKAQANGDCSIPETERVFFLVFMPLSHGHPPKALFFSKRWTVGRITDLIADKAGITNLNNTSSNMKLRLFIQDNGKVLSSDQVLADLLDGDQGVFNGGSLIMETVPADLLVLPDTHLYGS